MNPVEIHELTASTRLLSFLKLQRTQTRDSLTAFTVSFLEGKSIFLPGERVEGVVSVAFSAATAVRTIRVKLSGTIHTSESYSGSTIPLRSTLFKDIVTVFGSSVTSDPVLTLAGDHVFPFALQIPPCELPASYKSAISFPFAEVRYEVGAVLVRSRRKNRTCYNAVTIPSTTDPLDFEYRDAVESFGKMQIGKLWLQRGHVDIVLSIPREEVIPVSLSVTNHSSCSVSVSNVCLTQYLGFYSADAIDKLALERVHRYNYSEKFSRELRHVDRVIHFPLPPHTVISPTISTSILSVKHRLCVTVGWRDGRRSGELQVTVPVVIAGFPYLILDVIGRVALDVLPVYREEGQRDQEVADTCLVDVNDFYIPPLVSTVPRKANIMKRALEKVRSEVKRRQK